MAAKNNTDYESLVIDIIAKPLGMEDTKVTLTQSMKKRLAQGHREGVEVSNWEIPALQGCGALRSTAEDMLKYLGANMGIIESDLYLALELSHKYSGGGNEVIKPGLGWFNMDVEGVDVIWHDGGTGGYMTFAGFRKDNTMGVVVLTNSTGFPDDLGFHLLNPDYPLEVPKPPLTNKLNKVLIDEGIEAMENAYAKIGKNELEKYSFNEHSFVRFGYYHMGYEKYEEAKAVFKIMIELFPVSWTAYESYAEALLKANEKEKAVENYKKSIELNPENFGAIKKLKELGVDVESSNK